jgi:hypothetical protein
MTSTESFDPLEHCELCKAVQGKASLARRMPHRSHHDLCPRNRTRKTYLELSNEVLSELIQRKREENRFLKESTINLHTMVSLQSTLIDNLLQQLHSSSATPSMYACMKADYFGPSKPLQCNQYQCMPIAAAANGESCYTSQYCQSCHC